MINWRNGKGGFVGGLKHFLKGVFQYSHTITSETIVTPSASTGLISKIAGTENGLLSAIIDSENGLLSTIEQAGALSIINNSEHGIISIINISPTGTVSNIP